ncbi:hypothetical protein CDAR_508441 [Caerostris darwini]|uniref:Secreted protein n=1 Tax=Caerostris darwini TaxID=1538125 RepID=A0AAV4N0C3_9ARAC|nr:hypothetical protein CDAR_508441 [Caerostris darwini]
MKNRLTHLLLIAHFQHHIVGDDSRWHLPLRAAACEDNHCVGKRPQQHLIPHSSYHRAQSSYHSNISYTMAHTTATSHTIQHAAHTTATSCSHLGKKMSFF